MEELSFDPSFTREPWSLSTLTSVNSDLELKTPRRQDTAGTYIYELSENSAFPPN